jgi:hypothetical protein
MTRHPGELADRAYRRSLNRGFLHLLGAIAQFVAPAHPARAGYPPRR